MTQTSSPRALPARELADIFAECGNSPVAVYGSVAEATSALEDRSYVACGSITTAGEVSGIVRGSDR